MKPVLKLYLKEFLRAGCIFSIIMSLEAIVFEGYVDFLKVGFGFFWWGLFWSLGSASLHIDQIKELGVQDLTDDVLRSKHVRTFITTQSQIELIESFLNDQVMGKMSISKEGNKLQLISGIFEDAMGVSITIETLSQTGDTTEYKVVSQPRFNIGQPDFGKSLGYIIRLEKLLGYPATVTAD